MEYGLEMKSYENKTIHVLYHKFVYSDPNKHKPLKKPKVVPIESKDKIWHNSMHSIHLPKMKSGQILHKMALVQSQRNSTVSKFKFIVRKLMILI